MAVWDYTTQYIVDDYGTMLPNIFLYRNHHPWDSGSQGRAAEPEVDDAEKEVKTIAKTGKQAQNSRLPKFFEPFSHVLGDFDDLSCSSNFFSFSEMSMIFHVLRNSFPSQRCR